MIVSAGAVRVVAFTVVVPEIAPRVGGRNWVAILQTAQLASSVALTVAYIHP